MTHHALFRSVAAVAAMLSSAAFAQEIFRDDFNGGSLDLAKWQVMTHIVGRTQFGNTPVVSGGFARLRHDTYNPQAPGARFRGTELATNQLWSTGTNGIELEARVRSNAMPNGFVTSFFTYISRVTGGTVFSDEIDWEFLSTRSNSTAGSDPVLASTYNDFNNTTQPYGDEVTQSSREYTINALDLSQFNSFRIKWLPNRLEWYANGRLIRTAAGSLVPTDPTRARFNFWAPGTEWPAAYSSALNPTSNPANNQSAFYDVDWMVVRNARPAVSATAPNRVFTDRFNNGQVANSDSVTAFWQQRNQGSSTVTETTNQPLKLTAAGGGYPHAQIASAVRSEFNFFESPIEIQATGINFDSPSNSYDKGYLRFALSSQALTAGTQSEYTSDDALSLRIGSDNSIALGFKLNAPNHNSEFDGTNLLNETVSGPVRRINFVAHPTFYTLSVEHDLSLADGTPIVDNFNGPFSIALADWLATSGLATGDSALYIQNQLSNSLPNESMSVSLESLAVNAVKPNWNGTAGGDWNAAASWSTGTIPNYKGANAVLPASASPQTLTLNSSVTVGRLTLSGAGAYTLNGSASLLIDTPARTAHVDVLSGNHTISVPIATAIDTDVSIASGSTLAASAGISIAGGTTLIKSGAGPLQTSNVRGGGLAINAGAVRINATGAANASGGASSVTSLSIAGGPAAPTAQLDLADNALVIDYAGASPIESIRQYLSAGATGTNGITSSAAAGATRLGYAEGSELLPSGGTFAGLAVDGSSVVIEFALAGDADLNRAVDIRDFAALAANFGQAGYWTKGDSNYDGIININDFALLAGSFGQTLATAPRAAVPEPAGALIGLATFAMSMHRRNRRRN